MLNKFLLIDCFANIEKILFKIIFVLIVLSFISCSNFSHQSTSHTSESHEIIKTSNAITEQKNIEESIQKNGYPNLKFVINDDREL